MDATDVDFETKVIKRSKERVVLVDFWAPWCGPCLALGPVLEKVAAEPDAEFELVKVNVDESPQSATAYGVRGIPHVIAFKAGAPESAFTGAIGEADVRRFVRAATGHTERAVADKASPIHAALEDGDLDTATNLIDDLRGDPDGRGLLEPLEARLNLGRYAADHAPTIHEGADQDPEIIMAMSVHEAIAGNHAKAFSAILAVLSGWAEHREEARALLVDIIRLSPEDDAREMRRQLATVLY